LAICLFCIYSGWNSLSSHQCGRITRSG